MSLRGRIPDAEATYDDPILGVNLHSSEEDLQRGESSNMKNMVRFGRLVNRTGSSLITTTQVSPSFPVRGGHKFYYGGASPAKKRLIAYDTYISTISDAGAEAKIWTNQTSNLNTYFTTWSITDQVYIANGTNALISYDGTSIGPVGGVNIRSTVYRWISSPSQANEFYCELAAGGDPSLADPTSTGGVYINDATATNGTVGSLNALEWDYGDNDTLGFSTIYVRLADDSDPDLQANGYIWSQTKATVPGILTNPAASNIIALVDRLFAITTNGIERTDPRDPTIWSVNSSWATLRPSQGGTFKAHIPHTVANEEGSPVNGALAMTENAYYFYTGKYFGVDVTASTGADSVGEAAGNPAHDDAQIHFIDTVGSFGPKSVTSVPGVGTFWITTNKNVFYVPLGHTNGFLVGTRIFNSGGSATTGLEVLDATQGDDAWLVYSEPYLMLGYTVAGDTYGQRQWWMDMDKFKVEKRVAVWYGPMTGQTIGSVWIENSQGDNAVVAGEGNPTTGIFVYTLRATNVYKDKVGTADNEMSCEYSTYHKSGGAPSREKVVQGIEVEMNTISGTATVDIADLTSTIISAIPLEKTFT